MKRRLFPSHLLEFAGFSLTLAALTALAFLVLWIPDDVPVWAIEFNFPLHAFAQSMGAVEATLDDELDVIQDALGRKLAGGAVLITAVALLFLWLVMPTLAIMGVVSWLHRADRADIAGVLSEDHAPSADIWLVYFACALFGAGAFAVHCGFYPFGYMVRTGPFEWDAATEGGLYGGLPMTLFPLMLMVARRCLRRMRH